MSEQGQRRLLDRARFKQTKNGGSVQAFCNAPGLSDTATRLVRRVTVEGL